jgi:hypothetical protein
MVNIPWTRCTFKHLIIVLHVFLRIIVELSFNSLRHSCWNCLSCIQHLSCTLSFWYMLKDNLVWRFEWRTFYISSSRVKVVVPFQNLLKCVWLSLNKTCCSSFKFKFYLQTCTNNENQLFKFVCISMETYSEPTSIGKSYWVRRISLVPQCITSHTCWTYQHTHVA